MKRFAVLLAAALTVLMLVVPSFAAKKKSTGGAPNAAIAQEMVFVGEMRGLDGVGRKFWIRPVGTERMEDEIEFVCDDKSLQITPEGEKEISGVTDREFIDLYDINQVVTVKYVEEAGNRVVRSIEGSPVPEPAAGSIDAEQPPVQVPPGVVAGLGAGIMILGLLIYLFFAYCLFRIAKKLNVSAAWTAWVPVLNIWTPIACAGKPAWWVILLLIPLVNAIIGIYVWMLIAERLGKNKWLALVLLILVPPILLIMLAFGKSEGPKAPTPAAGTT